MGGRAAGLEKSCSHFQKAFSRGGLICLVWLLLSARLFAETNNSETSFAGTNLLASASEFKKLSLEDLMNLEITSVSKRPEKLSQAAAAIYVITPEDIRQSGALTVPEALRMAPGFEVARIDAPRYAISARGFNNEFANKLLVLVDGRAVYTPLFGGVFWNQTMTLMEDIDRIEMIRGPGGTLWGANAVNGVVNVITRNAKDTQGGLLSGGGGDEVPWFGSGRYGAKAGDSAYFRVYGQTLNHDGLGGIDLGDGVQHNQGGFRLDWEPSTQNTLTFQGDFFQGDTSETLLMPTTIPPFSRIQKNDVDYNGGNFLGRWDHSFSEEAQSEVLFYYDHAMQDVQSFFQESQNTGNIEAQHRFQPTPQQEVVAGLGYRIYSDQIDPGLVDFDPNERTLHLFNAYLQDEIEMAQETVHLILGSKFEHNSYTGFEIQPNIRLAWVPTHRQTLWAAVSRAVRTPSRTERDANIAFPSGTLSPIAVRGLGNPDFQSESVIAYELGYRAQLHDRFTVDLAGFYNQYKDLMSITVAGTNLTTVPPELLQLQNNNLHGETHGMEMSAQWQTTDRWSLRPSYSFLQMDLHGASVLDAAVARLEEGRSPMHQFALRSAVQLSTAWEFDCWLRYVDRLPSINIAGYMTADARLAWHPRDNLEFAVVGENLFSDEHPEFFQPYYGVPGQPAEVERSVYAKLTWKF